MRLSSRLLLVPILSAFSTCPGRADDLRSATVTQTYNDVKLIEPDKADQPAESGARIAGQRGVRTGQQSRAELEFQDKTLTRLGANTIFSFEGGTRSMEMQQGTMLLQVPKNAGGAKIRTAAVTAAITGTTILLEYTPDRIVTEGGKKKKKKGSIKVIVLEGTLKLSLNNGSNQTVTLNAGQMLVTDPNTVQLPGAVTVDLGRIVETSLLVNNSFWGQAGITGRTGRPDPQGRPARLSMALIDPEVEKQREAIVAGTLTDVNLSTSPYGSDVQTLQLNVTFQLDTRFSVQTESVAPPAPDKFGALPDVAPGVYAVDSASVFVLDPVVTGPGGTVEGRIYRGNALDGAPTNYLFGQAASAFDTSVGFNSDAYFNVGSGFPANGVTVFRFTGLNVTGSPTFQTAGGVYTDLALATTGNANVGGSAAFTLNLSPLTSFGLVTQNGSIALASNVTVSGTPATLVNFLARGANGSLQSDATINNVARVRLAAETNLTVGGSLSAANALQFVAGGNATINAALAAPSLSFAAQAGTLTLSPGGIATTGLTSLTASGRTINLTGSFDAGTSASSIVFNAGAGGFNATGFTLGGATRQISVNVTDGGAFNAQNFFGNSLVLTGGGAVNVPGTLDVTTLTTTGPLNVGTLNARNSLSLGSVSAGSIGLGGVGANFSASGNVVTDALSVPGTLTIGGFLRTAGLLPAAQRIVTAGGDITIAGDAGNPAGFPGDHYSSFTSTGGNIAVGTAASGLTLYADTISAAGSVRAGGFISERIIAGAGGIQSTAGAIRAGVLSTPGAVSAATDLVFDSTAVGAYTLASGSLDVGRDLQFDAIRTLTLTTGVANLGGRLIGAGSAGQAGGTLTIDATALTLVAPASGALIDLRGGAASGVGGAGGQLSLDLSGTGAFLLPTGNVTLAGGSGATGGAGGRFELRTAGSVDLLGSLDLRGGSGTTAGVGGSVAIAATGDLLVGGAILTTGAGVGGDGSVTLSSSAGSIVLGSSVATGGMNFQAAVDLQFQPGAALVGNGPIALTAGRDLIGSGGSIFTTDYDVTLTVGRDLSVGFFGGRLIIVGRNVGIGQLSFENATIGGNLTATTLLPYQPAGSTNTANVYRLDAGSVDATNLFFAAAAGSTSARTLQLNTAGGSIQLGGFADFSGGSAASGQTGDGGSLFVNVPGGSGTAGAVTLGSGFFFIARGADSTVDPFFAGGRGGTLRLFAAGDLVLGGAGDPVIDVRGGNADTLANGRGGSGGFVEVAATGDLDVANGIAAGTGVNGPPASGRPNGGIVVGGAAAGTGGTVNLTAGGSLTVRSNLEVSAPEETPSGSPAPPPQATSLNGGNVSLTATNGDLTLTNGADIVAGISDLAQSLGGVAGTVNLSAPNGSIRLDNGSIHNRYGSINLSAPNGTLALGSVDLLGATINFTGLAITIAIETNPPLGALNFVAGSGGITAQPTIGNSDLPMLTTINSVGTITVVSGGIFANYVRATGANADILARDGVLTVDGNIEAGRDIVLGGFGSGRLSVANGNIVAGRDIVAPDGIFTGGDPFTVTAGRDITTGSLLTGTVTVGRDLQVTDSGTGNFITVDANTLNVPGALRLTNVSFVRYNNAVLGADMAGTPVPFTLNAGSIVTSGFVPTLVFAGEAAGFYSNPGNGGSVNLTTSGVLEISADGQFRDLFAHGGDSIVGTTTGGDGGQVRLASGAGGFTLGVGSSIRATTGSIFLGGPNALGLGGLVEVVTAGPVTVNGVIETSLDDDPMAGFSVRTTSLSGGSISLRTALTSGLGIALGDGAELRADVLAGSPGGSISLTTGGADVNLGAARVTARGGVINIEAPNATVALTGSFLQAQQLNLNGTSGAPATLTGYGTIAANYFNAVTIRPGLGGASTGLAFAGNLTLLGSSQLQFQLGGLVQASQYGFIGVSGATTLGGQLVLSFVNGFDAGVSNTDTFTLLTSSSPFVGAFANIASGSRYHLPNGSFLVTYAGNTLVLSDFQLTATALAVWDNSTNNWSSGANWSTAPVFPNGNYSARIGGGSVNLDGAFGVVALQLYGGALGGAGSVDATDVVFRADSGGANFTGGRITASNGVVLESTAGSGTLGAISGNALLVNAGPAGAFFGVNGGRGFGGGDSAILRNAPGATFTVSGDNDAGFVRLGTGLPVFDNQGRFVRDSGSGLFGIEWTFDNRGEVEVESGTLGLGLGGTSSGEWRLDPSATLHLAAGTFVFNNGSQVTGGSVLFTGDLLTLSGATTGDAGWTFSGGTVAGAGSLTAGSLSFLRQSGAATEVTSGTLTATNGVRFLAGSDAAPAATLAGTALVISQGAGTFSGTANGDFVAGRDSAIFRNDIGATFTAEASNAQAFRLLAGTPTFDNRGTFVADSGVTGAFGVEWGFLNSGAVQVNSGKLLLAGGGSSTGTFGIASGALLAFTGGTYRLDPGTSFSGAGGVTLTGGTLTLGGAIGGSASLLLAGGDLTGPTGSWSLTTLFFQRGAAGATNVGSGTLTASNGIVLAAGAGVAPLGTLSGSAVVVNTNNGVFFGSANGDFLVGRDNAVFRNAPGATFDAQIDHNQAFLYGGGNPVFDNQGTFLRSVATGSFVMDWTFQNSGSVSVESGQLVFNRGGNATAGSSFDVLAGASLAFASGNFALAGGSVLGGAGSYSLSGGALDLAGAIAGTPNFVLQGGALTGSGSLALGTLTVQRGAGGGTIVNGPALTAAGGVLFQAGASGAALGELTGNTVLVNAGPGSFVGAAGGDFLVGSGNAIFRNAVSATFDAQADNAQAFASSTGTPQFENQGTFDRTTGTGTFGVQWAFANTGTVNVQSGTLAFDGGYRQTGASALLNLAGGNVSSPSALDLQSGALTGFGSINAAILNNAFIRPALAGAGLNVNGSVTLLAGSQLQFQLGGLTQGSQYGFLGVNGSVQLGGQLVISFANGFQSGVANANTFTLLTSSSAFSGAFANIASGSRLNTADGFGSFLVTYSGNALVLSGFLPPSTPNAVWDGGTNVWSSAANWSTNPSFPNGAFNATINGGTVTLDGAYSVLDFTLGGGTLAGLNTLTVNGTLTWSGGTLGGGGTFVANGGLVVNGSALRQLDAATLFVPGGASATDSGGHLFLLSNSAVVSNAGTWNATGPAGGISFTIGGTNVFNNSGAFVRNGTGDYTFGSVQFNNTGTVDLLAGNLQLNGGGSSTGGSFTLAAGTILRVNTTYTFDAASSITGAGAVNFTNFTGIAVGGTYNVTGGTLLAGAGVTFNTDASTSTLQLGGTTLALGPGRIFTASGLFTWQSGTLTGGTLQANGGALLGNASALSLAGTTLNVPAGQTLTDSGNHTLTISGGSILNLAGTFLARNNTGLTNSGGANAINNSGTFTRDGGTGAYTISVPFNQTGTAEALTGTLVLTGGGTSSGVFRAGVGAGLTFGANYAANAGTSFTGAGTVTITGGTFTLGGALSSDVAQFSLALGTLGGSGSLSTTGAFGFSGGTLAANVTAAGVQISGGTGKTLAGTLTNAVGATGSDTSTGGSFSLAVGGVFNNAGTFGVSGTTAIAGTGGTINNSGTFERTGSGTYTIAGAAFVNSGTVNVTGGTLAFNGGYTQTAGTLNLNGGSVAGSTLGIDGGVLTGAGTIAAAIANNAVLRPGLGGAGLAVTGSVSLLGASQLQFQLGGLTQGTQYGFLSVSGNLSLGGQLVVSFANNFQNTVSGADTFTLVSTSSLSGAFANIASGSRLNTVDGFGSFLVTYGGTTLTLSGYQINVPEALWLGGTGNWSDASQWSTNPVFPNGNSDARIDSGSVRLDSSAFTVRNFTLNGGNLNTAGGRPNSPLTPAGAPPPLGVTGLFTWTGGSLVNVGITAQNGVLLNGTGPLLLDGSQIDHTGGSFFDSGNHAWTMVNASLLNLAAPFFARNDSGILNSGTGNQINNQSVFTRDVGTGTYALGPFFFNLSGGTVSAATGTLAFDGGLTNDGTLAIGSAATVRVGTNLTGSGAISLQGGTLQLNALNHTVPVIRGTGGTVALGVGSALSLPGGFDFRGANGATPGAGGALLFTGSDLFFGLSVGQVGASLFTGGDASALGAGGNGGSLTVQAAGALSLGAGADLNASNGANNGVAFGGSGGAITLRAVGAIGIASNLKVSSTTAGFASANGGTLLIHSDALTGAGITLAAGGTLNAGISAGAFGAGGAGGSVTLETTGASTIDLQGVINAPNATVNLNPGGGLTLAAGSINNAGGTLRLTVGGALSLAGTNIVTDTLTATAASIFIDSARPFPLLNASAPFSSLTATAGSITGGFGNSPTGLLSLLAPAGGISLSTGLNNAFTVQARDNISAGGALNAFVIRSQTGSITAPSLSAGTVSAQTALTTNSLAADQVTAGSAMLGGNVNVRLLTVAGALDLTGANLAPAPNNGTPGVHVYTFGSLVGLPNTVVFNGLSTADPNDAGSGGTLNFIQTGTASLTVGGISLNGAVTSATPTGGSNGGRFTVDTPGAFTLVGNINALSGQIPAAGPAFFGAGGSVSIRSGGALSITQPIFTSLAQPTGLPHVQSASGGSIALTSGASLSVAADLAAGVSDAAFLAGGAGGSIVFRAANTFGITLGGTIFDAQNGLLDIGYTSGAGPVVFGSGGLTRLGARNLNVSGLSLDFSATQLFVSGAGVFNIGSGGVTGNAFFGLTSGGGTLTLNSAGPINLPAGIGVMGPLSAPSIATGTISAPTITTTSGDFVASGTIISDTVNVAGVFALNAGFNVFNAYTAPNAQGTPTPVSFFAGQYNAPSLQFDLNGVVGANANFAGDGGQLDLRSTTAGLPMFVASIIHNLNASGAPTSAAPTGGSNGGNIRLESAGDLNIGGPVIATTGVIPTAGPDFFGTGGTVQVFAAGTISLSGFNPGIRVSSAEAPGAAHASSLNGGIISLQSLLTTGRAIDALNLVAPLSNAALLAGGTPSSVSLTTPGGDIYLRGADVTNGSLTLSVSGPSGTVFLPDPNAIRAGTFNITAGSLNLASIFTPTVTGTATWNIGPGGITANVIGLGGGGLLNITSVGSVTAAGSVSANNLDLTGATSTLDVAGDLTLTGNLLRTSTSDISANTISLLGANAVLSSQGSVTTLTGNGIRLPGAGSSVQIAGSANGGAISAGSVGIGGNATISTGFLQPYGIEADSITVGGFVNSLNAVFFGPRTFVAGSPAPFTFSLNRFATQLSIFMPEVRANGQDTMVTGGNAGNGGSLGLTLTGAAGLTVGGAMPDVLAVTARGGDLPDVPTAGGNGGQITITSAGPVNVAAGGVVSATTGLLSYAGPDAWGTGGSITINAPTFSSIGSVVASQEEAVNSFFRASLNGGQISINASATSGVGITLGSGSFLLADRAALAGGTGGSITLTSNGSDISVDISGFISVNGGSLTIQTYRPGNPVAGNLSFFGSGSQFVSTASAITLRAASLSYGGDTNLLPAGTALTIAVGTMNSAASFYTDGSAPFALTATGDVTVGGNLGVQTFGSTSTVTLGLGNLSVTSQLRADTITSTGGTISARMIEARTINGFVVEATEGLLKVDTLTAASLASVNNGAFTYSTAGTNHVWNLGGIRGTGALADLDFRGFDGASSLPDGLRGETLTLTLGGTLLVDDPAATQGISSINFDGGNAATSAGQAGDGGNFTATINNDFKVAAGRTVSATTGQIQPGGPATSGRGGTVDVTASGNIEIAGTIQVSSDEPATPPRRRSNQGGNIRLSSSRGGSTPQTSIKIESTAQLNALLNAAATGPGGRVTIVATGTNARVQMDGRARADRGTVEIRSNGTGGSVTTSASTDVRGDIVKIGALGNNGILTIGGGTFSADTTLQLYATGSNGQVQFTGNTTLQGNSLKYIAGQTVTVNNSVQVNIQGTTPVQIFTNVPNYSGSGGNGSTTGTFTGQGAVTNPLGGQPGF